MHHLKWIAVPVVALGLVFLLFGMIWKGAVQLSVAVALLATAVSIWRTSTGTWPLTPGRATVNVATHYVGVGIGWARALRRGSQA